jgi:hypothetical protein
MKAKTLKGEKEMKRFRKDKRNPITKEVDEIISIMATTDRGSDKYKQLAGNLETLMKVRSSYKDPSRVDVNTLAIVVGNLLGIAIIVGYEQSHIITTKALGFVLKGRV